MNHEPNSDQAGCDVPPVGGAPCRALELRWHKAEDARSTALTDSGHPADAAVSKPDCFWCGGSIVVAADVAFCESCARVAPSAYVSSAASALDARVRE